MSDLQQLLKAHIQQVFEREEEFISKFCRCSGIVDELDFFYMASERCLISYFVARAGSIGRKLVTHTIRTDEFLDWIK